MVDADSVFADLHRIGAHLVSELGLKPAGDYQGVFASLGAYGTINGDLADRLGDAAGLRNLLLHDYGEIDHPRPWRTRRPAPADRLAREG